MRIWTEQKIEMYMMICDLWIALRILRVGFTLLLICCNKMWSNDMSVSLVSLIISAIDSFGVQTNCLAASVARVRDELSRKWCPEWNIDDHYDYYKNEFIMQWCGFKCDAGGALTPAGTWWAYFILYIYIFAQLVLHRLITSLEKLKSK